jgi:N6-adenosine-specific RNA methylase IME4
MGIIDQIKASQALSAPDKGFTQKIVAAWRSSFEGILETGRLLTEAKAKLPHGTFEAMVENDLPFKPSTAQRLMKIASDERLANPAHVQLLPPSWGTLYELTKLPDEVFEAKLADGTIHPEMQRKDVARENRIITRQRDEERVAKLVPVEGRFRTLVVDPPWDYEWLSLAGRAAPGYATMSHEKLLALPVESWAEDNSHLYLWVTNNFMTRGVDLMARWGFQHKTVLTWVKPRWGLGSYFRNSTEHVLFGVRGEMRTRSDSIATHFEAPMGEHSEKPEKFYEIVREASHGPYGEAFQRQPRLDFTNVYQMPEAEAA